MLTTSLTPPVLALVGWTFVMWAWLYATGIPAMRAARVDLEQISRTGAKLDLPPEISRVADYVGLRVVHSFVQATRNVIMIRFCVFAAASLALLLLLVNTIWLLLARP